jgi:hypothetical protein
MDRRDASYTPCRELLRNTREQVVIPSPVLVEVDYFVRTYLRESAFIAVLENIRTGAFRVEDVLPQDYERVREIIERYADSDIGFVDAAVLAIVERLNEPKLATLDRRHFGLLRPRHVDSLRLLPE